MASSRPKVLFVLTSHNKLGNLDKETGWYLPEFAHPYYKLAQHADIVVASPKGGEAPLDPSSVEMFKNDEEASKFLREKTDLWKKTEKLDQYLGKANEFAAVVYVGGHGPMFDLATSSTSIQLIREFYEGGKVVSAVCHGPAVFINATLNDGTHLIANQTVTGFSNAEEDSVGLSSAMPFMLETELDKNSKGHYVKAAEPWGVKVVSSGRDGRLITGQNPASAASLGDEVLKAIQKNK